MNHRQDWCGNARSNRFLQHGVLGHVVPVVHSYPGQDCRDGGEVHC